MHLPRDRQPRQYDLLRQVPYWRGQVQPWRSLPRSRKSPTIATMVAKQVSSTATNPGMDARRQGDIRPLCRQRAETYTTTKPMLSARTPDCFWVGTTLAPGGIAAACSPEGSWPGRRFRSPNSSDQDVVASPHHPRAAPETWDTTFQSADLEAACRMPAPGH